MQAATIRRQKLHELAIAGGVFARSTKPTKKDYKFMDDVDKVLAKTVQRVDKALETEVWCQFERTNCFPLVQVPVCHNLCLEQECVPLDRCVWVCWGQMMIQISVYLRTFMSDNQCIIFSDAPTVSLRATAREV